jgi:cellulose synthase/poly-beta-1,6-N-acetylglucosamine synthase-like glycosyltransferase
MIFLAVWFVFGTLALGPPAFIFFYMKRKSSAPWPTKIDYNYKPLISIIIPTYNEEGIIKYKIANLSKLIYPKDLLDLVVIDSDSKDKTVEIVKACADEKNINVRILVEKERQGKSHALNNALMHCKGEVVIISDADCFWPADILEKALPFLADPSVGAIGGPKLLFNSKQTWVTRMEEAYLKSANFLRIGESKAGSTVFFEGGFSAFKKMAIKKFDPYDTGSDDCGTIVGVIENNFRAMLVKEAKFYSSFPETFHGKISIKVRRINQLIRVFAKYLILLSKGKIKNAKNTVVPNTLLYLFSPIAFAIFSILTAFILVMYPFLLVLTLILFVPRIRLYFYLILENNLLLFISTIAVLLGEKFSVWVQPEDRGWLTEKNLASYNLI